MRGLVRMLIMFGPMLFRQYQNYQNKKARQQAQQPRNPSQNAPYEPRQTQRRTPPPPAEPVLSEDERNFRMKEEEFLLDKDLQQSAASSKDSNPGDYYTPDSDVPTSASTASDDIFMTEEADTGVEATEPTSEEKAEGFKLKDIFFKD